MSALRLSLLARQILLVGVPKHPALLVPFDHSGFFFPGKSSKSSNNTTCTCESP
jgi:hypothetical protein